MGNRPSIRWAGSVVSELVSRFRRQALADGATRNLHRRNPGTAREYVRAWRMARTLLFNEGVDRECHSHRPWNSDSPHPHRSPERSRRLPGTRSWNGLGTGVLAASCSSCCCSSWRWWLRFCSFSRRHRFPERQPRSTRRDNAREPERERPNVFVSRPGQGAGADTEPASRREPAPRARPAGQALEAGSCAPRTTLKAEQAALRQIR